MAVKYPVFREVSLNNKSRKGKYYYIKLKKGERGAYYKVKKGLDIEDYLTAYKGKIVAKRKGVTREEDLTKFKRKIKLRPKVEDLLLKGYSITTLKSALSSNQFRIKKTYSNLLSDVLRRDPKDKHLINILLLDENVQKFKFRLGYKIHLVDANGDDIANCLFAHKGKTLNEVVKDFRELKVIGSEIGGTDYSSYQKMKEIEMKIRKKGYIFNFRKEGKIKDIHVDMEYRKGTKF